LPNQASQPPPPSYLFNLTFFNVAIVCRLFLVFGRFNNANDAISVKEKSKIKTIREIQKPQTETETKTQKPRNKPEEKSSAPKTEYRKMFASIPFIIYA